MGISEGFLALFIELNEIADRETRDRIENVLRNFLGDRPANEIWKVWIHSIGSHCQVVLEGPNQTRQRVFFDDSSTVPEKIRDWLDLYPPR